MKVQAYDDQMNFAASWMRLYKMGVVANSTIRHVVVVDRFEISNAFESYGSYLFIELNYKNRKNFIFICMSTNNCYVVFAG